MTYTIMTPLEIAKNHFDWAEDDEAITNAISEMIIAESSASLYDLEYYELV